MMTRDEILNMPAGREFDALIAENVMGEKLHKRQDGVVHYLDWTPYTTDTRAAWQVVKTMYARGFNTRIEMQGESRVTIWSKRMTERGPEPISAKNESVSLAICRAALITVLGVE
jgi:hypothetical protein